MFELCSYIYICMYFLEKHNYTNYLQYHIWLSISIVFLSSSDLRPLQVREFIRGSGNLKGEPYRLYDAPTGVTYKSLRKAQENGFKAVAA